MGDHRPYWMTAPAHEREAPTLVNRVRGAWRRHAAMFRRGRALVARRRKERQKSTVPASRMVRELWSAATATIPATAMALSYTSLMNFALPVTQGRLIDSVGAAQAAGGDMAPVWAALQQFCYVLAAGWVVRVLEHVLYHVATDGLLVELRRRMFAALLAQEPGFFDEADSSRMAARISTDTTKTARLANLFFKKSLRGATRAVGGLASIYFGAHALLFATAVATEPLLMAFARRRGTLLRYYGELETDSRSKAMGLASEVLASARLVHEHASEDAERARFEAATGEQLAVKRQLLVADSAIRFADVLLAHVFRAVRVGAGMWLIVQGEMSVGQWAAYRTFLGAFRGGMEELYSLYLEAQMALGESAAYFEVVDREPRIPPAGGATPAAIGGALALRDVWFAYPAAPDAPVLRGVTLDIPRGSLCALVGPSGSGKSTVVRLLQRLYDADRGVVALDGADVRGVNARWLRRHVAVVSQDAAMLKRSIRENIVYGLDPPPDDAAVERAARAANIWDFIAAQPAGLATEVGERGATVSGGQRQRLAIARALVRDPAVLLLDEATSALDTASERLVQAALDRVMRGRTTVVIAHRLSTVRSADNIAVVVDGRVVEQGAHEALMVEGGVYASLVGEMSSAPVGR